MSPGAAGNVPLYGSKPSRAHHAIEDRLQDDQRQGGDDRENAGVSRSVEGAALPDPNQRLL
jgi:hypothetical protein